MIRRFNPWVGIGWIVFLALIVAIIAGATVCSALFSVFDDAATALGGSR